MDWLRRNWPDLMIGVALIAVIGGIAATLLTGGTFFRAANPTANPATADGPSVTLTTPDTTTPTDDVTRGDATNDDPGTTVAPLAPDGGLPDTTTPPGAPSAAVDEEDAEAAAPFTTNDSAASDDGERDVAATETPTEASVELPSAGGSDAPYRVSVGAFSARGNAETYAQRFQDDGYPVFLGVQGNLTIVLVGPYATQADAERVAGAIRDGDYETDPVIYLFQPDEVDEADEPEPAPTDAAETSPATNDAPSATTGEPSDRAVATTGTARSMQVGAFMDQESAEPLLANLESLGFSPNVFREDGLIKITVGPFQGSALDDARTILDGAGIAYFNR